ncbi:MAG: zinc ribbon domain-containing protein [Euryarchaeota archaeon]|nr:zinc ribbon domain-containing protein [Euryarchaeota archaeon]
MATQDEVIRTVVVIAMVVILMGVLVLELRFLRARRKRRMDTADLPDRAHNAILTTKAIAETLARGGVRSQEADDAIREADAAYRTRNYRVAIELADRAKSLLRAAKQRYQAQGDLAKIEGTPAAAPVEEITTKEKLTKELPPNYAQSRFSLNLAGEEIEAARSHGQDVQTAERHLADAQVAFDAQDYDVALRDAIRARRALETVSPPPGPQTPATAAPPPPTPPSPKARACTNCGTAVAEDDAFCRKCGAKLPAERTCPSCGSLVPPDDAYCRTCGAKVQ